eukprot:7763308-Karenia_brevis.AAC.1
MLCFDNDDGDDDDYDFRWLNDFNRWLNLFDAIAPRPPAIDQFRYPLSDICQGAGTKVTHPLRKGRLFDRDT